MGQIRSYNLRKTGLIGRSSACDIGIAGTVYGYTAAIIRCRATDIAAVGKHCTGSVDLGYKSIVIAIVDKIRPYSYREAGFIRFSVACDIGIAGTVHGYTAAIISCKATDIAAVNKLSTRRCDLGHKSIIRAIVDPIKSHSYRKAGFIGRSKACDIGIAGAVHGYTSAIISSRATDIATVD